MTADSTILMNCGNCGACCMGQNLLPLSGAIVDQQPLPPKLGAPLLKMIQGPLKGDDGCACVWLDRASGSCLHYEYRPSRCRDVIQVGDETCMRIRREAGIGK